MHKHTLSKTKAYERVTIKRILLNDTQAIRLMSMGLAQGVAVDILHNRRGDIVLRQGQNRISMGKAAAEHIVVQTGE